MRRRLFVQIYLSFLGVSLLTLVAGAVAVRAAVYRTVSVPRSVRVATDVLLQTLPDPSQAPAEFRDGVVRLARRLGVQGSVWTAEGRLLARVGDTLPAPPAGCPTPWMATGAGHVGLCFQLPSGRWVAVTGAGDSAKAWALRGGGVFFAIFGTIALGCYPLARRITRRLEALQAGVQAFGEGELDRRVTVVGRDEVAELAHAFNASADRVAALVEGQRRVLAHASHELRSPLARLRMQLALLEDADDSGERAALAREATGEIGLLDDLIEDVLLASRLRGGVVVPRAWASVDVAALAEHLAHRHGAHRTLAPGVDGCVWADERLLQRALSNLLRNAERHGAPPVEIVLSGDETHLQIDVLDRGPGVPPEQAERVFEPFFRHDGHAEGEPGVGLGLTLVDEIVRHHQGSVAYHPREGGGACFRVHLPRAPAARPT